MISTSFFNSVKFDASVAANKEIKGPYKAQKITMADEALNYCRNWADNQDDLAIVAIDNGITHLSTNEDGSVTSRKGDVQISYLFGYDKLNFHPARERRKKRKELIKYVSDNYKPEPVQFGLTTIVLWVLLKLAIGWAVNYFLKRIFPD